MPHDVGVARRVRLDVDAVRPGVLGVLVDLLDRDGHLAVGPHLGVEDSVIVDVSGPDDHCHMRPAGAVDGDGRVATDVIHVRRGEPDGVHEGISRWSYLLVHQVEVIVVRFVRIVDHVEVAITVPVHPLGAICVVGIDLQLVGDLNRETGHRHD